MSGLLTTLVFIGSLCEHNFNASLANSLEIPATSNITLPGLITATQNSGAPLPLPILVSRGFLETGLSGKILIQTLPSLFIFLVRATRQASICLLVIQAGSIAFKPKSPNATELPL